MTGHGYTRLSMQVTVNRTVHTADMALSTVKGRESIIVSPEYHDQFQDFIDAISSRFQRVTPTGGSGLVLIGRVLPNGNPVMLALTDRFPAGINLSTTSATT